MNHIPQLPPPHTRHVKCEYLPGVATTHEVIEILDSDDDEVTGPRLGTDDLLPQWADSTTGALSKSYLEPQPTNTLALFEDWWRGVMAGGGKKKENEDPGHGSQVGDQLHVPCFPDVHPMLPFPLAQIRPTQLPPIWKLVSEMPEAGPSTPQNMWAPVPVLHVPATVTPATCLPGMDQLLQGPPGLPTIPYVHTFFLSNSNVTRSSFTSWSLPVVDKPASTIVKLNLSAQLLNLSLASTQTEQISHHPPISAYIAACPAWHITLSGIDQISVCILPSASAHVSLGMMNKGLFLLTVGQVGRAPPDHASHHAHQQPGVGNGAECPVSSKAERDSAGFSESQDWKSKRVH
ncbi:hypothetical protein EDB89DRAFT_1910852 [Lactarius sanguifluus]|nr:hypothetical protein EDB89DRAFT_1910852 [Lactarius sanguifluus]